MKVITVHVVYGRGDMEWMEMYCLVEDDQVESAVEQIRLADENGLMNLYPDAGYKPARITVSDPDTLQDAIDFVKGDGPSDRPRSLRGNDI